MSTQSDKRFDNLDVRQTLVTENSLTVENLQTGDLTVTGPLLGLTDHAVIAASEVFVLSNVFPDGIYTPSITGTSPLDLNGEVGVQGDLSITSTLTSQQTVTLEKKIDVKGDAEVGGDVVTISPFKGDDAGEVFPGKMAMFSATLIANLPAVTGDETFFTVPFDDVTERNDFGTAMDTSTGIFTSPKSGLYLFSANVLLEIPVGHSSVGPSSTPRAEIHLITVPRKYVGQSVSPTFSGGAIAGQVGQLRLQLNRLVFVPDGETVYIQVVVGPPTGVKDVGVLATKTRFQGIYMSV